MKTKELLGLIALGIVASAVQPSFPARTESFEPTTKSLQLATGQYITPMALSGSVQQFLNPGLPAYPNFVAGQAVRSQLSPDGTTLAILCAGQNSLDDAAGNTDVANSTQYIFLYDVTGANKGKPVLTQVIQQTNAHVGLVFSPDGKLYAADGKDDAVYVYAKTGNTWSRTATIKLGHGGKGVGIGVSPNASGLGISTDGATLVVANNYNDSISVIDTATGAVRYEHDLRPYYANNEGTSGGVGGSFPFGVVVKGNRTAYVSSDRDREIVVIDISSASAGRLVKRIKLDGNALGMTLDASGSKLFVAEDNADLVAVIDTASNAVVAKIDARAPAGILPGSHEEDDGADDADGDGPRGRHTGAATFAVTLSRDGNTLYAVNAGANSVAVIPLKGEHAYRVAGLIPTAYDPHDITFSADGSWMYIINGKSITGPNPARLAGNTANITSTFPGGPPAGAAAAAAARASNQYQFQLERASLVSAPVPASEDLERLTQGVAANNFYSAQREDDQEVMGFLRQRIKHVIYIVKENRTFDQVLGDLGNGSDGRRDLTQFPESITPNFHHLARQFVTLDNFMDPGDGSATPQPVRLEPRTTPPPRRACPAARPTC